MSLKEIISGYFSFGKRDRAGIVGLLCIIAIIYFLPILAQVENEVKTIEADTSLLSLIDTLEGRQIGANSNKYSDEQDDRINAFQRTKRPGFADAELFLFDPNTLNNAGWQRLGLSEKTAATIQKYVGKGGRFRKPEDLQKIWGLPTGFYERVAAHIRIAAEPTAQPFLKDDATRSYQRQERKILTAEINSADTSAFIALPGIGSKLAYRITNFRDKLGGFYSVEQVKETYGLPDSTFQKIRPYLNVNAGAVRKLNINTATKDELKLHPYIKWNLANAIVEYRNQHGPFKSLSELKGIVLIDDTTFEKIAPYMSL